MLVAAIKIKVEMVTQVNEEIFSTLIYIIKTNAYYHLCYETRDNHQHRNTEAIIQDHNNTLKAIL